MARTMFEPRAIWAAMLPPLAGAALLVGVWALLTTGKTGFPSPGETFEAAVKLLGAKYLRGGMAFLWWRAHEPWRLARSGR